MTRGDVTARYSVTAVREHVGVENDELAGVFIDELIRDTNHPSWPAEMLDGTAAQVLEISDHLLVSRPPFEWANRNRSWFWSYHCLMDT